jgi:hypothetical protein
MQAGFSARMMTLSRLRLIGNLFKIDEETAENHWCHPCPRPNDIGKAGHPATLIQGKLDETIDLVPAVFQEKRRLALSK